MSNYVFEEALEAATAVTAVAGRPVVGIILGSGLGPFAKSVTNARAVPYTRIPNFPPARVEGHAGQLVFGEVSGVAVAVLAGRVHFYEGHSLDAVTLPTRVLAALGVRALIVTNAAGGIREDLTPGTLMAVTDHLNLQGANPLQGPWDPRLGHRHPDLSEAYDPALRAALHEAAKKARVPLSDGVYAALSGPSYETPAEIRMLRVLGADAVGMSTVPEVIVANQMGMRALGVSCISNRAAGLAGKRLSHKEVMEETDRASKRFSKLLRAAIPLVAATAESDQKGGARREDPRSIGYRMSKAKAKARTPAKSRGKKAAAKGPITRPVRKDVAKAPVKRATKKGGK